MLAIVTAAGCCLVDASVLRNPTSTLPVSSSLECTASVWSQDNSQLYIASSNSIKRYTPSSGLLEEIFSGSVPVACLSVCKGSDTIVFTASNRIHILDCESSPGRLLSTFDQHRHAITSLSVSDSSTLLVSLSASGVLVHDLAQSSHTLLRGLPPGQVATTCVFHEHSRTRILLGIGKQILVYDATRPSGPLKTIKTNKHSSGHVVALAVSPFSKTLVAAAMSTGDVCLIDLNKEQGMLKTVAIPTTLTACSFTMEGAAIYLGTESGKLLLLDLRALEKAPKSFIVGNGDSPVMAIHVQSKPKNTTLAEPQTSRETHLASSPARVRSKAASVGARVKPPVPVVVGSTPRSGAVTPKKKLLASERSPLTDRGNRERDTQRTANRPSLLYQQSDAIELRKGHSRLPSASSCVLADPLTAKQPAKTSATIPSRESEDAKQLLMGTGTGPDASRSTSKIEAYSIHPGRIASTRTVSEPPSTSSGRRPTRLYSVRSGETPMNQPHVISSLQHTHDHRSTTPENDGAKSGLTSPDLPREPVTPISLGTNKIRPASRTRVLDLGTDVEERTRAGKEKEKETRAEKMKFLGRQNDKESDDEGNGGQYAECFKVIEEGLNTGQLGAQDRELSMQISPRRPAPSNWMPSPHRPVTANLNATAQDFLRNIVRDVMYDFQDQTKAELRGLHLDLVRMGRGWRRELRDVMEEWRGEILQLREENKRLREENERLRRGY